MLTLCLKTVQSEAFSCYFLASTITLPSMNMVAVLWASRFEYYTTWFHLVCIADILVECTFKGTLPWGATLIVLELSQSIAKSSIEQGIESKLRNLTIPKGWFDDHPKRYTRLVHLKLRHA